MSEEDLWKLIGRIKGQDDNFRWRCGGCWKGVLADATRCPHCGVALETHPLDEPWRGHE